MTTSALYRDPVILDSVAHRSKKLAVLNDFSVAAGMHACYLAGVEFATASRQMVIVFVRNTDDPAAGPISPVVMMGVEVGENLYIKGSEWDGRYQPAYIRRYPFWTARLPDTEAPTLLIDAACSAFSDTEGEPLFDAEGKPAPKLEGALKFVENFEFEAARTKVFCERLVELELLRDMKADLSLPGGKAITLDGFLVIDREKFLALPDDVVLELHRNGTMALIYAHLGSLENLQELVDRKARRMLSGLEI